MNINLFGLIVLPIWLVLFVISFIIVLGVFWLWAIVDCLASSKLKGNEKLFWFLIIFILNVFGALLYLIFSATRGGKMTKNKFKGKKLMRSKDNRIIAGVCGGIGEYFNVDPTIVRIVWILFCFVGGAGILAYIIALIIMPERK